MTGDIKLKPCPFCGGEGIILSDIDYLGDQPRANYAWVECKNDHCGARTKRVPVSIHYAAEEVAAERWNRREWTT